MLSEQPANMQAVLTRTKRPAERFRAFTPINPECLTSAIRYLRTNFRRATQWENRSSHLPAYPSYTSNALPVRQSQTGAAPVAARCRSRHSPATLAGRPERRNLNVADCTAFQGYFR